MQGDKSVSLSLVLTNAWTWRPAFARQVGSAPVTGGMVGLVQNYVAGWGCAALTLSLRAVVKPGPIVAPVKTSGLVDARGNSLGRP
jgi:hypothetical protein